jgi:hypothetical protein
MPVWNPVSILGVLDLYRLSQRISKKSQTFMNKEGKVYVPNQNIAQIYSGKMKQVNERLVDAAPLLDSQLFRQSERIF